MISTFFATILGCATYHFFYTLWAGYQHEKQMKLALEEMYGNLEANAADLPEIKPEEIV